MFMLPAIRSNCNTQSTSDNSPLSSMPRNKMVYCPSMVCSKSSPSFTSESGLLFRFSAASLESTFASVPSLSTSGCHSFQYFMIETCWVVKVVPSSFLKLMIGAFRTISRISTTLTTIAAIITAISRGLFFFRFLGA